MNEDVTKRRTFAIISHPDAGKTTLTEKLLLFGGAINLAGTVKSRKASKFATSDWMALEQQRGISVSTSVMQFDYKERVVNLLDTPGHADFSEDTYRTLTAVDSALMVIDGAKGVEERTIKLMEVCRLRNTPIMTFINKFDRECKDPISLMDEIEEVLKIQCVPITWPLGMGKNFYGVYHFLQDKVYLYQSDSRQTKGEMQTTSLDEFLKMEPNLDLDGLQEQLEMVREVMPSFELSDYLEGKITPVHFGSAVNNFGVSLLLDDFVNYAPAPKSREAVEREVMPDEKKLTGFVFKIQANMDPKHRDRVAFMRVCSGFCREGMKLHSVRLDKKLPLSNMMVFMAGKRAHVGEAYAGDIIGIPNHGTIQIGDTFSEGEDLHFLGIPNFAPELFKKVRLNDPLKSKALLKGLTQLSEEGATQVFKPLQGNDLILGAVGMLQFDVVAYRLKHEYNVDCRYEATNIVTARWVNCDDEVKLKQFTQKYGLNLAHDGGEYLTYLAPSYANLRLTEEKCPEIAFSKTREH